MKNTITSIVLYCFVTVMFSQKTISASDLIQDIKKGKDINLTNTIIEGVLDFTFINDALPNLPKKRKWWSNNNNSNKITKIIESKISFVNCTFKDNVLAYIPTNSGWKSDGNESGYTFTAKFENIVIFKDCIFEDKAMFKYSEFEKNVDFSGSKFMEDNTFKYAQFDRAISFKNTFFDESATFKYAQFKQNVSFSNSVFEETATFKYTKFRDGVSFNNTKFKEDLNLKYTKVTGEFDITNIEVTYDIDSKYTSINGKSFSKHLLNNK